MKKRIYAIIAVVAVLIVSFMAMQHNGVVYASTNNSVGAKSYIVVDTNSSKILYEYKPHEKMPVASICKLMTSLITLEKIERNEISLDDKFVASDYCASVGGSSAFLDSGCEYTVRELLKSVIVALIINPILPIKAYTIELIKFGNTAHTSLITVGIAATIP